MENIQPLNIWQSGQTLQAEKIDIQSNFDDLKTIAIFYYCLYDKDGLKIVDGNLTIEKETYQNWDGSNAGALQAVADILKIEYIK